MSKYLFSIERYGEHYNRSCQMKKKNIYTYFYKQWKIVQSDKTIFVFKKENKPPQNVVSGVSLTACK